MSGTATATARRSALYMPGSNVRAIRKARELDADAVILDMEDSVAPAAKAEARALACTAVREGGFGRRAVVLRINGLATPWGADDLDAAIAAAPDAILVPKVQAPEDVLRVAARIPAGSATRIWAMIETPRAVLAALPITDAVRRETDRLAVLVLGLNDLSKETCMRLQRGRAGMLPLIATVLAAGRANGLDVLDGVCNEIGADDLLREECEQGRDLGLDGKTLIHPSQVAICNAAFSPCEAECAWARAVVAAFDDPAHARSGVIQLEGKMVERLHLEMAQRILRRAPGGGSTS
jgi:citrate lyase subunit beta/citryl-CoA lyase